MRYPEGDRAVPRVMTVTVDDPKLVAGTSNTYTYRQRFRLSIPDEIRQQLAGKTFWRQKTQSTFGYDKNMPKSLSVFSIETLCETWNELVDDCIFAANIETLPLRKVIFFEVSTMLKEWKSEWNSNPLGDQTSSSFRYMVGYVSDKQLVTYSGQQKTKQVRYDANRNVIRQYGSDSIYSLAFVTHTDEREAFFAGLMAAFATLKSRLDGIAEMITEDQVDQLCVTKLLKP